MTPPRTLLAVSAAPFVSGAETSLLCLLRALDINRLRPLLACPAESPLWSMACDVGIETFEVPPLLLRRNCPIRSALRLRRFALTLSILASRRRPDAIHANGTAAALGSMRTARKLGVPLVWHVRDVALPPHLGRMVARRSAAVVAISRTVAEAVAPLCPPGRDPLVNYNGIDSANLQPTEDRRRVRERLGAPPNAFVVLYAAQLVPWKRPELALEVFAGVCQQCPGAVLWLAGCTPTGVNDLAPQLSCEAKRLGIDDAVRLLGHRSDMPDLYAAADAFLATSRREPLGRAVMEAMTTGLPVVATDEGGHVELIDHGVSGLLFDAAEPQAGAGQLLRLFGKPDEACAIGNAAQERIRSEFSVQKTAEKIQTLYDRLFDRT